MEVFSLAFPHRTSLILVKSKGSFRTSLQPYCKCYLVAQLLKSPTPPLRTLCPLMISQAHPFTVLIQSSAGQALTAFPGSPDQRVSERV